MAFRTPEEWLDQFARVSEGRFLTIGLDSLSDQHKQEAMNLACDLVRAFAPDVPWSIAEDGLPEVEMDLVASDQDEENEEEDEDVPHLTQVCVVNGPMARRD